jgi:hypothetical protein
MPAIDTPTFCFWRSVSDPHLSATSPRTFFMLRNLPEASTDSTLMSCKASTA